MGTPFSRGPPTASTECCASRNRRESTARSTWQAAWIIPPFAEAHNHNIDGAVEARSLAAIRKYVADGVFYVKIQGNYPLTDEQRRRLPINRPGAPDVAFAQAFITATGGHPTVLHEEILLRQGYYPGIAKEGLRDTGLFHASIPSVNSRPSGPASLRSVRTSSRRTCGTRTNSSGDGMIRRSPDARPSIPGYCA